MIGSLSVSLVMLPLLGCTAGGKDSGAAGDGGDDGSGTDTDPGSDLILDLELVPAPGMATVATVTFRTAEPMVARAWLQAPDVPEVALATPTDARTEHELLIIGAPEGLDSTFRIEVEGGGVVGESDPMTFSAGLLPAELPRPVVPEGEQGLSSGYVVTTIQDGDHRSTAAVIDAAGRLVWAWRDGFSVWHRARLLPGGTGVAWLALDMNEGTSGVAASGWDGKPLWQALGDGIHQDFDMVDDETALILGWEIVADDDAPGDKLLWSDTIVRLGSDGSQETVWRLLDDVPFAEHPEQRSSPDTDGALEWAHTNFLEIVDGQVYLTALFLDGTVVVDMDSWTLSLAVGIEPDSPAAAEAAHSAWPSDEGLIVFGHRVDGPCAGVLRYPDPEAPGQLLPGVEPCHEIGYLGNAQPMSSETVLVDWSESGVIEERGWDGTRVGGFEVPVGFQFGYAEWFATLGG